MAQETFTVRQVAERLCVSVDTVRSWIKSQQLRGILVSVKGEPRKPRYVVPAAALSAFERERATAPLPKEKGRVAVGEVIEFFP